MAYLTARCATPEARSAKRLDLRPRHAGLLSTAGARTIPKPADANALVWTRGFAASPGRLAGREEALRRANTVSYSGTLFAMALCDGQTLTLADLPEEPRGVFPPPSVDQNLSLLAEMERGPIARVLETTGRNKGVASRVQGVPRTTL